VVKVFSLAAPPVTTGEYLASLRPPGKPGRAWMWMIVAGFVLGGGGVVVILWRRPKRPAVVAELLPVVEERIVVVAPAPEASAHDSSRNAVYLMGEFVAYDQKGNDITHLFSPKIKQLFVLILLHSMDGKGIGSKKISAKLWPEKDPAKTKNIKGVTFNHLRSILSDIEGIELVFQNDHYSFQFGEAFFCDFCVLSGADPISNLRLMARGPLLADVPEAVLDDFKSSFEDRLIGLLIPEMIKLYGAGDFKLAQDIAKLILTIDSFNEEALKYQLKSCRRLKGIEYSRKAYEQFTQGYEKSLGVAYHVSFDKILG
jgi:two-component SAPR family response regulator